ncbi:MAG: acetyltransferase [Rhodanobacteraceae bacterium]
MIRVVFWGATGQAKVLRDALPVDAELVAVFDNREIVSPFKDVPIFHGESGFARWESAQRGDGALSACVAIGGMHGEERVERMQWLDDRGYRPFVVVHTRAFVASDAVLAAGCQVMALGAVCTGTKLGRAVIVNTKASIDHDCAIGDGVHIAPGATLAGEVDVGEFAFVGTGAVVLPRVRIGTRAIIGAGAVVTCDVGDAATVAGNPARILRERH